MAIDVNAIEQTVEVTAVGDEVNVNIIDQPVLVSVTDQIIEVEASGGTGPQGPAGAGVAAGGTTGQVLSKASNTNYDTVWVDAGAGTVHSVDASGSTGISVTGGPITGAGVLTITNTAPDQVVVLTQGGTTTISGTYPNFTISSADQYTGTVTSVNMTVPTGLTISGNPITSAGTLALALASGYTIPTQALLDSKVPYIGATTNVDLGEYELKAGQLTLDVSPTGTASVGTTRWNNTIGSSETTLKGGSVILKNGVDLVARVVNKVTPNTTLTKAAYQAVRVSGAAGQRLAVAYAQANNDNNSADTIGLVCETIATNQEGFIITVGQLEDINTTGSLQGETWADGDVLYLSPTTPGAITNVKPAAPQHLVVIGYVEYAHANNGKIYVKVMNGWELGELHDVNTTGAVNGSVLKYNGSIWVPSSDIDTGITSLNGLTALSQTFATGTSGTDFNISSASSTHTFNLPTASSVNRGLLSAYDWTSFDAKIDGSGTASYLPLFNGTKTLTNSSIQQNGTLGLIFNTNADLGSSYLFRNNSVSYPLYYSIDFINYASPKAVKHYYSSGIVINEIGGTGFVSRIFNNGNHIIGGGTTDNGYRLEVQGTERVTGTLTVDTINNATTDTDKFLVSDAGVIKYRTGAELLSDIGGQASGNYITALTGEVTASGPGSASATLLNSAVIGKVLTGLNLTGGGTILATDSILQAFGKTQNQISALVGGVMYEGVWNANTNSPAIVSGVGNKGDYYVVNVAGSTNIDGISDWKVGDWIIFNGTNWDKVDNTDAVSSVNGFTGAVNLTTANISEVTNLYFTDARVMSAMLTGYTIGSNTAITFNDSVLTAFGKAQAQINTKQNIITLTTTGSSGSATFISDTLNVPTYTLAGLGGQPQLNGTGFVKATGTTISYDNSTYALDSAVVHNTGTETVAGAKTFTSAVTSTNFVLSGGTGNTGLYYGHTNKVVLANYTVGGGIDFETNGGAINMVLDASGNLDVVGNVTGASIIKSGGTSSQFLKADGSVDSSVYYLASNPSAYIALTALTASAPLSYNNTTGAFTISQASGSTNGYLSSTDWTTFNNKQNALTNPVTGTGTTNYLPKWTSGSAIGNSIVQDYGDTVWVGANTSGYGTLNLQRYVSAPYATLTLTDDATPANEVGIYLRANGSNPVGISSAGAPIAFYTSGPGNTERLRITNGGNILINSTTDNGNRLQVTGNGYFSGSVGIGTASVTANTVLDVSTSGTRGYIIAQSTSATGGSEAGLRVKTNTKDYYIFTDNTTDALRFYDGTASAERMRLDSSGRLGIGTSSPGATLDTNGTSFVRGGQKVSGYFATSAGDGYILNIGVTGNIGYLQSLNGTTPNTLSLDGNDIRFRIGSFSEAMRLDSSGNLGIGTSSPDESLVISKTTYPTLKLTETTTSNSIILNHHSGTNEARLTVVGAYPLIFKTSDAERARFTAGGNLLLNSVVDNGNRLQVTGNASISEGIIAKTTDGSAQIKLERTGTSAGSMYIGGDNIGFKIFDSSFNTRVTLTPSGNLGLGVVPSAWSNSGNLDFDTYVSISSQGAYGGTISNNAYYNAGWKYKGANYATQYQTLAGEHRWLNAGVGGAAGNAITFTQAMTLTAAGRLLLGTTTEGTYLLDVNGTMRVSGASTFGGTTTTSVTSGLVSIFDSTNVNGGYIVLRKSNVDNLYIGNRAAVSGDGGTGYDFYSTSGLDLRFFAGATKALTLATTGAATFSSSVTATNLITSRGGGNWDIIPSSGANTLYIKELTGSTEIMTFDGTNKSVGIGTTSPSALLHTYVSTGSVRTLTETGNSSSSAFTAKNSTQATDYGTDSIGGFIQTQGAYPLLIYTNSIERMRITSGGNLLVGTTTDSGEKLQVSGNTKITVSTNGTHDLTNGTIVLRGQIGAEGRFGTQSNHDLVLTSNNTTRITVKAGGVVNIANVPSSSAGLSSGDIYKDASGFLKIV